jgi:hypothetical protein
LFLDYRYFAISVQILMFGSTRIYCDFIFTIVVLGDFRRIGFAKMQSDMSKRICFTGSFFRGLAANWSAALIRRS